MCREVAYLPENVITHIFTYLEVKDILNAAQTCRTWYSASCDPQITKRIAVINHKMHNVELTNIDFIRRPFAKLTFLNQNFNKFAYKEFFSKFGYLITELFLDECTIRLTQLYEIYIYLCNLQKLTIYDTSRTFFTNNVTRYKPIVKNRDKIERNLLKLRYLNVQTYGRQLRGLKEIVIRAPDLEELYVNKNFYINTNENDMYTTFLDSIDQWNFRALKHLDLQCLERAHTYKYFEKLVKLKDVQLISFGIGELSSMYYSKIFKAFCTKFRGLHKLRIREINDMQLAEICHNMVELRDLEFENCAAGNLYEIGKLTDLRRLSIIGSLRNQHVIRLFNQPLEKLKSLKLEQISKEMLRCICEKKNDLEELELINLWTKDCSAIYNNLVKLKKLSIRWFIAPTITNKEDLDIPENSNITNLTELEYLSVNHFVPGMTFALIEQLPKLRSTNHRYLQRSFSVHQCNATNEFILPIADQVQATDLDFDLPEFQWYLNT